MRTTLPDSPFELPDEDSTADANDNKGSTNVPSNKKPDDKQTANTNTQKPEQLRRDIRHRAGASRLLWQQLTLKKKPVELPPITTQPIIN